MHNLRACWPDNGLDRPREAQTVERLDNLSKELEEEVAARTQTLARANDDLAERAAFLQQILDTSGVAIFVVDTEGRITQANQRMAEMFGWSLDALMGDEYFALVHPLERDIVRQKMLALLSSATTSVELEQRYWRTDQTEFWGHLTARRFSDAKGEERGLVGVIADITVRKRAEEALKVSEERWKFALEGANDGVWDWNVQTGEVLYSKRWKEMFGFAECEIGNTTSEWLNRVHPEEVSGVRAIIQLHLYSKTPSPSVEYRVLCKDGGWKWTLGRGMVVSRNSEGEPLRVVGTNTDITERKQMEDQVRQLALYDTLTTLPNRRLLNDRLSQTMAASKRSGCYGALMFLDLDNFKPLNDTHGHVAGDLLLIEAAVRLKSCVRETDTVARFGGDEFVVMLSCLNADKAESTSQAEIVAGKLRTILSEPYLLTISDDGREDATVEHHCTASIGVVVFINHEGSQDDVLEWADTAMYEAKEAGRNMIRFYDSKD